MGFPFKGVPVKLGIESGSKSWSESYSRFCANYKYDSSLQLKLRNQVRSISSTVVNAFNTCISSRGLHVWLERTYNPREFKFAARFNPPNKDNPVAIIQTFDEGSNVSCKQQPVEVDSSEFRSRCTRKNDNPVSLVVNADWAPIGGGNLTLPAIPKHAPIAKKPTIQITNATNRGIPSRAAKKWAQDDCQGEPSPCAVSHTDDDIEKSDSVVIDYWCEGVGGRHATLSVTGYTVYGELSCE